MEDGKWNRLWKCLGFRGLNVSAANLFEWKYHLYLNFGTLLSTVTAFFSFLLLNDVMEFSKDDRDPSVEGEEIGRGGAEGTFC